MKRFPIVVAALFCATAAFAQSGIAVKQSGNVITPGQVPWWITSGVIGGGVTAADSPITSFGVTNNGGNGFCVNSDRVTAAGRNTLCFGTSTTGASTVSVQNYGTATAQALQFCVNGTCYNSGSVPLNIVQTGPTGGSTVGPYYFNFISSFFNSTVTGNGIVAGLQVQVGTGASASAVEINGGSFSVTQTASGVVGEQVGITSGVEILAGFSTVSNIYGAASAPTVHAGSSTPQMTGHETDNFLYSSLVPRRFGYSSGSFGDHNATTFEAAYGVFTAGGSTNSWKNVIALHSAGGTLAAPVATDANFFTSDFAITMARILDLRNFTVANYIIDGANTQLTGTGILALGSTAAPGAMTFVGGASDAMTTTYQYVTTSKWTAGASASTYFVTSVGAGANAIQIDNTTNKLAAPSGLTVTAALSVTSIPTSAGAGGLNVCVDTAGVFYKKATCP